MVVLWATLKWVWNCSRRLQARINWHSLKKRPALFSLLSATVPMLVSLSLPPPTSHSLCSCELNWFGDLSQLKLAIFMFMQLHVREGRQHEDDNWGWEGWVLLLPAWVVQWVAINQLGLVAVEVSYTDAALDHAPIKFDAKLCVYHVLAFAFTICI